MASFDRGDATLHYDVEGDGFPVLLIAPGGMRSANDLWLNMVWNPRAALADASELPGLLSLDLLQRLAERSRAAVAAQRAALALEIGARKRTRMKSFSLSPPMACVNMETSRLFQPVRWRSG